MSTARHRSASNGVTVGSVTSVLPSFGGRDSRVVMAIGSWARRIHTDATATIYMRTFVSGSMYIALNPGSSGAPLLDGPIGLRD